MRHVHRGLALGILLGVMLPARADIGSLRDLDQEVQVSLPAGWVAADPDSWIRIRAFNPHFNAWIGVLHKPKDGSLKDLKSFAEASFRLDADSGRFRNSHMDGPRSLTINGHPALQYVQKCYLVAAKEDIVLLRTYIELDHSWNAVLCWGGPAAIEPAMPDCKRIIESFSSVDAPPTTAPAARQTGI